jgi:hypothetical protein
VSARAALPVAALAALSACNGQSSSNAGVTEPIVVHDAQLISGSLPGPAPLGDDAGGAPPMQPALTNVQSTNALVLPGQAGKQFQGRAVDSAFSIGMRLADIGTGYWVVPIGPPDPQYSGELSWQASIDFNANIPPGKHPLRFVAIDGNGNAGQESELVICAESRVPDNLSSCDPTIAPPDAVISLVWDQDVDLDLQVIGPDGTLVTPKHPATMTDDAGAPAPGAGVIDRDSLASCVPDGRRQEDLVWQKRPSGAWDIYANLFSACGKPATRFTVIVYESDGDVPNRTLTERYRRSGVLTDISANGDSQIGLFVVEYPFD